MSNETPKTEETVRIKFGVNRVEQVASLPKDEDGKPTGELGVLYVVTDGKNYYMTQVGVDGLGYPTYDYVETYDTWDGLVGTQIEIPVAFSKINTDSPTVSIANGSYVCYSMDSVPDSRT